MLPKEEKKVKDEEVVVRHGGGDRRLPFALHGALQDTVALAKSLHNCLEEHKKKVSSVGRRLFWGGQTWRTEKLAMAEGRYVKGEHMVMVWCTGTRCEGQEKKKSDGQQKRKKGRNDKKTICPAKNPAKNKNEKSHQHGPHGNRPISTLETDLRVSL